MEFTVLFAFGALVVLSIAHAFVWWHIVHRVEAQQRDMLKTILALSTTSPFASGLAQGMETTDLARVQADANHTADRSHALRPAT